MTKIVERKDVRYYESADGFCPYAVWRSQLDVQTQAVMAARISRLETGNPGQVETVGAGVHELKIDFGPGFRIYFGNADGRLIIILAGGTKRRQSRDVAEARANWKDWKAKNMKNTPNSSG